jgi:DNA-binding CsgD family transcriptional regulator
MLLDLYRCARDPQGWIRVLDRLCEDLQARSVVVQAFRFDRDDVRVAWQMSDSWTSRRASFEARLDQVCSPRIDRGRMLGAVDRAVGDDDIFKRGEPALDSMRAQLAQNGLGSFMGMLRMQSENWAFGIALHRAVEHSRDFGRTDATQLEKLAPHFGQAWELGCELQAAQADTQRMRKCVNTLRCGVLLCDAAGRVQWMNHSAHGLIDDQVGLTMSDGVLRASRQPQSARLRDEIAATARAEWGTTRYLAVENESGVLHLAMRPHGEAGDESPAVLIAITSAGSMVDVPVQAWCNLLRVTPAEATLVAALAQGKTLDEYAAQRGISTGTARNQLKQVLTKTRTSRQVDLVRLALTSAAAHVLSALSARRA